MAPRARPRRDLATLDLFDLAARARLAEELAAQARAIICEHLPQTEDQVRLPRSAWRSPEAAEREVSRYLGLLAQATARRELAGAKGRKAAVEPARVAPRGGAEELLEAWRRVFWARGEELLVAPRPDLAGVPLAMGGGA